MNNPLPNDPAPEPIAHAAAAWVLRCDRGLTAAEQDEFSQWLASDPRHGVQLARHRRHWDRLETLAQWRPEHSARPNPDLLAPSRRKALRFFPIALVAAAAVAVVFFCFEAQRNETRADAAHHGRDGAVLRGGDARDAGGRLHRRTEPRRGDVGAVYRPRAPGPAGTRRGAFHRDEKRGAALHRRRTRHGCFCGGHGV